MDTVTTLAPVSLAPLVFFAAAIGAGLALVLRRRILAIVLGLLALVALAAGVLWTLLP